MAIHIPCGTPKRNEIDAIDRLRELFEDDWALLTNLPRTVFPREMDACLLGPKGMMVLELKNHSGPIRCPQVGLWDGIPDDEQGEGNPAEQAEDCAQKLKGWLTRRDPSLDGEVYVDSLVVMTHPDCALEIDDAMASRVGLLGDSTSLVNRRLRRGLDAGIPERVFKLITNKEPSAKLISNWRSEKPSQRQAEPTKRQGIGRSERQSSNKILDRLSRLEVQATELCTADPFSDHAADVKEIWDRYCHLTYAMCTNARYVPTCDAFLGNHIYMQGFQPASQKDFDDFNRLAIDFNKGLESAESSFEQKWTLETGCYREGFIIIRPQREAGESEYEYERRCARSENEHSRRKSAVQDEYETQYAARLNASNGFGTNWRFYEAKEVREASIAGLENARSSLMELACSFGKKYAAFYDDVLVTLEAIAQRYDNVELFQTSYSKMTELSSETDNDLPPDRVGYRWPVQRIGAPITMVRVFKNKTKILAELIGKVRQRLEIHLDLYE